MTRAKLQYNVEKFDWVDLSRKFQFAFRKYLQNINLQILAQNEIRQHFRGILQKSLKLIICNMYVIREMSVKFGRNSGKILMEHSSKLMNNYI